MFFPVFLPNVFKQRKKRTKNCFSTFCRNRMLAHSIINDHVLFSFRTFFSFLAGSPKTHLRSGRFREYVWKKRATHTYDAVIFFRAPWRFLTFVRCCSLSSSCNSLSWNTRFFHRYANQRGYCIKDSTDLTYAEASKVCLVLLLW